MTLTPTAPVAAGSRRDSLFSGAYLPLALGAVALVTLGAFENRAVGTALPTLVQEFHAVDSFGVANAAPTASYLVALAVTGLWADRRGPVPALRAGIAAFALAQLMIGGARSMPMVVGGRLLSGLAEGLIDIALMVLVARVLPPELRPRMFSLFAAMWVLPSVFGPLLTGVVTEAFGWRWVFLGALVLLVPTWLMLRPAVRTAAGGPAVPEPRPDPNTEADRRRVLPWAVTASAALFALTVAGAYLGTHRVAALAVVAATVALLAVSATRLLPAGTARAGRGFPSVVLVRGLSAAAFGGSGAFLPLLLTLLHGFGPSAAGVSLSITGVMWAAGSWLQGREHPFGRVTVLRAGLAAMTVGLAGTSLLAWPGLAPWPGLVGWAVAGIGMGLTSPTLSVLTLDLSRVGDQGRNSSAAQMAGSISTAVAFAVGGALVAVAAPTPGASVFGSILAGSTVAAGLGLLVAARVERS